MMLMMRDMKRDMNKARKMDKEVEIMAMDTMIQATTMDTMKLSMRRDTRMDMKKVIQKANPNMKKNEF